MFDGLPVWLIKSLVALTERSDRFATFINRRLINASVNVSRNRPHPWSTVEDYVSWTGLSDTRWSARHLPPVHRTDLPAEAEVAKLFARSTDHQDPCPKSTCLFPAFAQYLTDGFIRTRMPDPSKGEPETLRRQNTSNHQIDLCPLYGRTGAQTTALRLRSNSHGERGRLKSQSINGEEYAPFLFGPDGQPDPQFQALDWPLGLDEKPRPADKPPIFAFGGDRANAVPQVAMLNTLFLREHNRLAGAIERQNRDWDDDRVFQTARNTLIALFIKLVVEDYINHIAPTPFRIKADAVVAYKAVWNRTNWITTEFSLLYRWHSLIPDEVRWAGRLHPVGSTLMRNDLLLHGGLAESFLSFCGETAGRLGAFNTAAALVPIEVKSVAQGRICELAPFFEYRRYVQMAVPGSFADISARPTVQKLLKELYGRPEGVEFYPGLFAEDTVQNSPLPPLILRLVAVDAFSQALTNPLLSEHVFKEETFSEVGWKAINETGAVRDLVERNTPHGLEGAPLGMTRADWSYAW